MYNYFIMLKAIRVDVDHGLLPREEWQAKVAGEAKETESKAAETEAEEESLSGELDVEAQFHLHFSSLLHILTNLTLKAEETLGSNPGIGLKRGCAVTGWALASCQTAVGSRHKNYSLEIALGQSAGLSWGEEAAMQVLTKRYPKNSLLTVMDRYSSVVRNMEQVVMIPSLLQDVHLGAHAGAPNLYNYFIMLKAIRVDVDHGLLPREEWQAKVAGEAKETESKAAETEAEEESLSGELDVEAQFHLHFSSLLHILTNLTLKAEEVTKKYQEITGQAM
ncbi:Thyroid hormone-inducible hepatic protein [Galemys pyrenaicus]|uniref:Thyroid hormone-inducible hepatic protein n=1 Tax=Galemys pyrenaicus TaxID=202257 RepID=A0A8J6A831_GALPY|nr:Thyroid hormone-inducible hepatic protein [Galemys pyrenaicus]